jgi:hypothetical protein
MPGFLDPQRQIIDMVLTDHGKMLLSQGELRIVYWAAYDDDVVYGQSGTLTEEPLQREATMGYKLFGNLRGLDTCNVNRALMSVPPGQAVVPTGSISFNRDSLVMTQQPVFQEHLVVDENGVQIDAYSNLTQMGVLRFNSSDVTVSSRYGKESYPASHHLEGFYVRVLASGSAGYIEQHHTLSDDSEIVVGPDLKITTLSYGK